MMENGGLGIGFIKVYMLVCIRKYKVQYYILICGKWLVCFGRKKTCKGVVLLIKQFDFMIYIFGMLIDKCM